MSKFRVGSVNVALPSFDAHDESMPYSIETKQGVTYGGPLAHEAAVPAFPHPRQLDVLDFNEYALVIDARSPHEYEEDHIPGAVNLPVVDDAEYAEVGIKHKDDPHAAYLIGVEYSLQNMARYMRPLVTKFGKQDRMLVYCFRGGKRSKLWGDTLRTIGFEVDVLRGGWKNYRRWVREGLDVLFGSFQFRVLSGSTGSGKTRLLAALRQVGEQSLDLEYLARHRGSLIGAIPDTAQPSQKGFESSLVDALRRFDPGRPVWIEAESRKIGSVHLPTSLFEAMGKGESVRVSAPIDERVRLWRQDYPNLVQDPIGMVKLLEPLKPLVGGEELALWRSLAAEGKVDELFERVMSKHYDPCYARSTQRAFARPLAAREVELTSLSPGKLGEVARDLAGSFEHRE